MPATVVVGLQLGDEGKGKIVDFLAAEADVVVRFSGGANACHTVVVDGEIYRFYLIPSGAIWPHTTLVIADGVVIDPFVLTHQIAELRERNRNIDERLVVGKNAIVTLPYHIQLQRVSEELAGRSATGVTGAGVGPTRADQAAHQAIRIDEYLKPEFMKEKFFSRVRKLITPSSILSRMQGMLYYSEEIYKEIRDTLIGRLSDTPKYLNDQLDSGKSVLFEGSQGTLLDTLYGYYPYVTSGRTLAGAACTGAGVGPTRITEVVGVARAFTARIFQGPLPTEVQGKTLRIMVDRGHEYHFGNESRCGWLDLVGLKYASMLNSISWIALTKLDALDEFSEFKVCVGYRYNGDPIDEFPIDVESGEYEPILTTVTGWNSSTSLARSSKELPSEARHFIAMIEEFVGIPIRLVSVGREREQTFFLD